jgi:peptidoglycan/LPS O-acetylase OafA/YrhL
MTFDASRLRRGELLAAAAALLLLALMFLCDWYGSASGWQAHTVLRWLMLLTILAALALAFLTATQRTVAVPVTTAVIVSTLSWLLLVLVAYRVIVDEPGPNALVDVTPCAWLGLLCCALIAYGAYLSMRDEGRGAAG